MPTTGFSSTAARCSGPVSPPITSDACRISGINCPTEQGNTRAKPSLAAATRSASGDPPGDAFTTDRTPARPSAAATAPNRSAGHTFAPHPPPAEIRQNRSPATASRAQIWSASSIGSRTRVGVNVSPTAALSSSQPCSTTCVAFNSTGRVYNHRAIFSRGAAGPANTGAFAIRPTTADFSAPCISTQMSNCSSRNTLRSSVIPSCVFRANGLRFHSLAGTRYQRSTSAFL